MGKARKFYTVVTDLESGRMLWPARGKGAAALAQFWPLPRLDEALRHNEPFRIG